MKKSVLAVLFCVVALASVSAQDTPNPPANLQTLPSGSYVIAMDNTLQSTSAVGTYGKFNMKAYGLIIHLLNNNVKVKWVIAAGKAKDAADFTVNAEMTSPSFVATASRDFKSGPFVIYPSDTTGLTSLVNSYYTAQGLTGNNRPKMFRTTNSATVDIRYDLTGFVPYAAILDDGGNAPVHQAYFTASGITVQNYSVMDAIELSSCYTFASEPHNSKTGAAVDAAILSIKAFVQSGRNFLAQCHAIENYENSPLGGFQTTGGIDVVNHNISTTVNVSDPDLAYYQYEGAYSASDGGSVKNWKLNTGSSMLANASGSSAASKITGKNADTSTYGATIIKTVAGLGGLVFYLGNHDFTTSNEQNISGMRMYMNALLMPTQLPANCMRTTPLPVRLASFQGNLNNNKVNLQWTVADNDIAGKFEVEKSLDGENFNTSALLFGSEKTGMANYQYAEAMKTEKVFYRLRMTDKNGSTVYSNVLMFQTNITLAGKDIRILNNPANDKLSFSFQLKNKDQVDVKVVDLTGRVHMKQTINGSQGDNTVSMQLVSGMQTGMYIINVTAGADHFSGKFIKQ